MINNYQELANAIIEKAAEDYRKALRHDDEGTQYSIEKFFRSSYFSVLTSIDPEYLIDKINSEERARKQAVDKS